MPTPTSASPEQTDQVRDFVLDEMIKLRSAAPRPRATDPRMATQNTQPIKATEAASTPTTPTPSHSSLLRDRTSPHRRRDPGATESRARRRRDTTTPPPRPTSPGPSASSETAKPPTRKRPRQAPPPVQPGLLQTTPHRRQLQRHQRTGSPLRHSARRRYETGGRAAHGRSPTVCGGQGASRWRRRSRGPRA